MNRFEKWIVARILRKVIRQGAHQNQGIVSFYGMAREAFEQAFYEESPLSVDAHLRGLFEQTQVASTATVPPGTRVVPLEPDDTMIRHLVAELQGECVNIYKPEGWWEDIRSALRDAIAAAPRVR